MPVSLQTIWRDTRVTTGGVCTGERLAGTTQPGTLAQALVRRYSTWHTTLPVLGMAFRQARSGDTVYQSTQHTHVHLAPRLAVALWTGAQSVPSRVPLAAQTAATRLAPEAEPTPAERLAQRLAARAERRETVMAPGSAGAVPLAAVPTAVSGNRAAALPVRPVPRVWRRSVVLPASPEVATHLLIPSHPVSSPTLPAPDAAPRPAAPVPLDVNRLTDHVVQAIDRRFNAYRERLGRR